MGGLLSFDIWDTILRRRCHPDEVKLFTARTVFLRFHRFLRDQNATPWTLFRDRVRCEHEIGREVRERSGLDDEYEIQEVLTRWLMDNVDFPTARRARDVAADLADQEMRQEIHTTYVDEVAEALVKTSNGARLVAISDFYMGEGRLRQILEAKAPHIKFDRVFVSCDVRLNKRSGRVLTYAQHECGVGASSHVHVGNSIISDVKPAKALGVRAVHFKNAPEDELQAAHERRFSERPRSMASTHRLLQEAIEASCSPPPELDKRQAELYRHGARFSPVIASLVLMAVEQSIKSRVNQVFYCTREGDFFGAMHRAMAPAQPHGVPMAEAVTLHVSRIATFFPSLRTFSVEELMRIWNMYSWQSMRQLLTSFHVPQIPVEPFLAKYAIDIDEEVRHPWKDRRVMRLLDDPLFLRLLDRWRVSRRRLLFDYFHSRGFPRDLADAVIVDIGWRGTIMDNIAHLFPRTRVHAFYLSLLNMLNEQPSNCTKAAIGPDARHDSDHDRLITRWVAPFEMLCNSPNGSVRDYVRLPDNTMGAATLETPGETEVHEAYTRHFQAGAIASAGVIADWVRRHAVTSAEMRPLVFELMRQMATNPPPIIAEAFFKLSHNETFGKGEFHEKHREVPHGLIRRSRRSSEAWAQLVEFVEETSWPQGFLALHGCDRERARYTREAEEAAGRPALDEGQLEVEAAHQLTQLESSLAWRVISGLKRATPYSVYARSKWGAGWDSHPEGESAAERLRRLRASRAYALIEWIKSSWMYRAFARSRARRA